MVRNGPSGCWCNDLCMRTFAPDAVASLRFFRGSLGAERHDKRCCGKQAACHATKLGGIPKHEACVVMSIASVIFSVFYFSMLFFLLECKDKESFLSLFRMCQRYFCDPSYGFLWPEDRSFTFATPGAKKIWRDVLVHREWRVAYTSNVG